MAAIGILLNISKGENEKDPLNKQRLIARRMARRIIEMGKQGSGG
jgi:hypothetical protein